MKDRDNQRPSWHVPAACCLLVAAMLSMAYASVPLYDWFCRVTGYGGTPSIAVDIRSPQTVSERALTIRFDANVIGNDMALRFKPERVSMSLPIGKTILAHYISENPTDATFYGMATYNATPQRAASYVVKTDCFCFSQHRLAPGERMKMPVAFYIDPAIEEDAEMDDIHTITLSYTFFATPPWSNETENES